MARGRSATVLAGFGAIALAMLAIFGPGAVLAAAGQRPFVLVAQGKKPGLAWQVGVARRHGKRCYGLVTLRGESESDLSSCDDEGSDRAWRPVTGSSSGAGGPTLQLDLTSARVATLRLTIHRLGTGGTTRRRTFHPRLLTERQSRQSGMPRDFRYLVIVEPQEFCVEGIEARDRRGRLVAHEPVPCEF